MVEEGEDTCLTKHGDVLARAVYHGCLDETNIDIGEGNNLCREGINWPYSERKANRVIRNGGKVCEDLRMT